MSFPGYFQVRFFLSALFAICLFCFVFSDRVRSRLFWCNSLYLVITAGFVADPLIMRDKQQQRVRFCVILLFCFYLSSSCDTVATFLVSELCLNTSLFYFI